MDPIYYESRLISLIYVEKIPIYMTHSAVKWGRKCENETEMWRDSGCETGKEQGTKEHKGGEERASALKSLCIHSGFWSCEMSSHRSQESDKLGKKLYFASRAAKSIKVMPSAYININGSHTNTRAGQREKWWDVLMGLPLLLLFLKSKRVKIINTTLVFKIFCIKARLSVYCQSDGSYSLLLV